MRNHSGRISFDYNTDTLQLTMEGNLLGAARNRWDETKRWVQLLEGAKTFSLSRPPSLGPSELTFSWNISAKTLQFALQEYAAMAKYSLRNQLYSTAMEQLFLRWEQRPEIDALTRSVLHLPHDYAMAPFYNRLLKTLMSEKPLSKEEAEERILALSFGVDGAQALKWGNLCIEALQGKELSRQNDELLDQLVEFFKFEQNRMDLIIATAESFTKSNDFKISRNGLALFTQLFEKREGFNAALRAAIQQQDDLYLFKPIFGVVKKIIKDEYGCNAALFNAALSAATQAVESSNDEVRAEGYSLLEILIDKEWDFNAAISAATEAFKGRAGLHYDSVSIFKKLFKKGKGFNAAIRAATEAVQSSDTRVKDRGFFLFEALVESGQGFDAALNATTEGSKDFEVREAFLYLLKALVEKKQGFNVAFFNIAFNAFTKGSESSQSWIQHQSARLYDALREGGYMDLYIR